MRAADKLVLQRQTRERARRIRAARVNPKDYTSVYSKSVSLGYPYLRGEGRMSRDGRTWLSRSTKTSDGTGPAIFVGWDHERRKWVIERENPEPAGLLTWRSRQRHGAIMRPETFGEIERRAARAGARDPQAVAGAAYWTTAEARYRGHRRNVSLVDSIRHGDRVTILVPAGIGREGQEWKRATGRAVMRSSSGGWVLNMGGRYGTPAVADERNIVSVKHSNPGPDRRPGESVPDYHRRKVAEMLERMPKPIRDVFEREAKRTNPLRHKTVPQLLDECDRLRAALRSRMRTYGNPDPKRIRVSFDPAVKKFLAVTYDPVFGNLYATGHTKKQAAKALLERWREYRRSGKLPPAGGYYNPDETEAAAELYREFHGRDPREILALQRSDIARQEYTALGDLVALHFRTPEDKEAKVNFEGDGVKLASSANGRQLYFLGGNQDLSKDLARFGGDPSKDFVDLGDAVFVSYDAQKWQTDFKPVVWEHSFGEQSKMYPRGVFDQLNREIFLIGGNYRVERPGIVD